MTLPSREGILVQAMRANTDITASAVGQRIATRLSTYPGIRVTVLGGAARPTDQTGQPEYQIEVWGAGPEPTHETEASTVAGIVEEQVATGGLSGTYPLGTIRGSYVIGDLIHSPDPTTRRERYILTIGLLIQ